MITRSGLRPSSTRTSSWAAPTGDATPWVVTAMPVAIAARAAARWTRSSAGLSQGLSVPISPMIPGRTPVPSTPCSNSAMSSAASSPTVRRAMRASGG